MSEPSAYEQYALELINAQRLDPQSAANLYGLALNSGLPAGTISAAQLQPLVFDPALGQVAKDYSQWLLTTSTSTAPFAYNDTWGTDKVTTITLDVLSNDDSAGTFDPASLVVSNQSWNINKDNKPELSIKPDGTIDFDPRGAEGTFTFTYSVSDSTGQSTTATATVVVADTDETAAAADSYQTDANEPLSLVELLENDFYTKPDSETTIKIKELPTNGDLFLNGALVIEDQVISVTNLDNLVYRPTSGYVGNDQFLYELESDDESEASVSISVLPPASTSTAPFAQNDAWGTDKVTTINLDVLSNDSSTGTFDPASLVVSNQSWNINKNNKPELSIQPDGTIDFDPRGAKGTFTFNYSITDSTGQITTATATVVVANTNKTAAAADSYQTDANEPLSLVGLLENDFYTKPDSQTTIKIKELPTNGD
ncbi:MAG: Ig-like domain-containing protein, partial [Anderseniella sp.]